MVWGDEWDLTWDSSRAWGEEKGIWDTVLEFGEPSLTFLTSSLEKSSRRKVIFWYSLLSKLPACTSLFLVLQMEARLDFLSGASRDCAGRLLLEWCRRVLVFLHLKLFFSPVCWTLNEFGKYCFLFHAFCRVHLLTTPLGFILKCGIYFFASFVAWT